MTCSRCGTQSENLFNGLCADNDIDGLPCLAWYWYEYELESLAYYRENRNSFLRSA